MIENKVSLQKNNVQIGEKYCPIYRVGEAIILQFQIIKIMFGLKGNTLRQQRNFIHDNINNDEIQSIDNLKDFFIKNCENIELY